MARNRIIFPTPYLPDPTQGRPLANANLYIGEPDLDPEIEANRKTIIVIQEDGTEVNVPPASQPLVTGAGGIILYQGSPVQLEVEDSYSFKVTDEFDVQVYYFNEVTDNLEFTSPFLQALNFYENDAASASNAYVIEPPISPAPDSLLDDQLIAWRPSDDNTGASTLNVIGDSGPIGTKPYKLPDGTTDTPADYIKANRDYFCRYDQALDVFRDIDLVDYVNNKGINPWSNVIEYITVPSYVTGSDEGLYKSALVSGPNNGGAVDPVGDTSGTWIKVFENEFKYKIIDVTADPYVVLADNVNGLHRLSGAADLLTMPAANTLLEGQWFKFVNNLATNCRIEPNGGDTFVGTDGFNSTSGVITIPPYSVAILTRNDVDTEWVVTEIGGNQAARILDAGSIGSVTDLDFDFSTLDPTESPTNVYAIRLFDFQPANDDVELQGFLSSDGGTTEEADKYHSTLTGRGASDSINGVERSKTQRDTTDMVVLGNQAANLSLSNGTDNVANLYLELQNMNTGLTRIPHIKIEGSFFDASGAGVGDYTYLVGAMTRKEEADYDFLRLRFESGTFAAQGRYVVYKLNKPV